MTETPSNVTPGELLLEEFLKPMAISQYRLAKEIGVPAQRISAIVHGGRSITADTDLRLCRFFGLSDGYWLRAQAAHDIEVARQELAGELDSITPWRDAPVSARTLRGMLHGYDTSFEREKRDRV